MGITRINRTILPLCSKKRLILPVGMFLLSSFFLIIILRNETSYLRFEPWFCSNRTEIASDRSCFSNATKTILFYTPMFGSKPWPGANSTEEYLLKCPTKKCQITYNVYDIGKRDLVIFHARDMQSYVRTKEIQQIHNYRCPQQRMAFLNQESIVNDPDLKDRLSLPEGFFNWTISLFDFLER